MEAPSETKAAERSAASGVHAATGLSRLHVEKIAEQAALGAVYDKYRFESFSRLLQLPFPTAGHELWRQTKPEQFAFEKLLSAEALHFALLCWPEKHPCRQKNDVVFSQDTALFTRLLNEIWHGLDGDIRCNPIMLLHSSLVSTACVVQVKKGALLKDALCLSSMMQSEVGAAVPYAIVELEPGSNVTIVDDLDFKEPLFLFPRLEFLIRANACLNFISIQRLGSGSTYLARHRFHLRRDASLRAFHLSLGASLARLDYDCRLYEPGAAAELCALYLADGQRHVDFHPLQEHLAPHCSSNLLCKGVLRDQARGVYYGLIRVAEAAQKTDAYQKNKNLLLSPRAHVDSIPNLEIRANDVKCSHGATAGRVSADELFYLMTRGLSHAQAEQLLVEGFFEDVMAKIADATIHEYVRRLVWERVNHGTDGW